MTKDDKEIVVLKLRGRCIEFMHTYILSHAPEKEQEIRDKNHIIRTFEKVYHRMDALVIRDEFDKEIAQREQEADNKKLPIAERDLATLLDQLYEKFDSLCKDGSNVYREFELKIRQLKMMKRVLLSNKNGWGNNSSFLVEEILDAIDDAVESKIVDKNKGEEPVK